LIIKTIPDNSSSSLIISKIKDNTLLSLPNSRKAKLLCNGRLRAGNPPLKTILFFEIRKKKTKQISIETRKIQTSL